jgi:hypothetical protein
MAGTALIAIIITTKTAATVRSKSMRLNIRYLLHSGDPVDRLTYLTYTPISLYARTGNAGSFLK